MRFNKLVAVLNMSFGISVSIESLFNELVKISKLDEFERNLQQTTDSSYVESSEKIINLIHMIQKTRDFELESISDMINRTSSAVQG